MNFDDSGITTATNRAVQAMNSYEFNNRGVVFTAANVRFAANLSDFDSGSGMDQAAAAGAASTIRFVKVITPVSPVPMSFVGFLLGNSQNLTAQAVAGVSAPLNVFTGYLPLFLIDDNSLSTFTPGNLYTIRSGPGNSISPTRTCTTARTTRRSGQSGMRSAGPSVMPSPRAWWSWRPWGTSPTTSRIHRLT